MGGGGVLELVEESDHLVRRRLTRDGREPAGEKDNIYYPPEVRRGEYWGLGVLKLVEESDHLVRRRLTRDGREPGAQRHHIYYPPEVRRGEYCERRYFRAVHIFAQFVFLKYP